MAVQLLFKGLAALTQALQNSANNDEAAVDVAKNQDAFAALDVLVEGLKRLKLNAEAVRELTKDVHVVQDLNRYINVYTPAISIFFHQLMLYKLIQLKKVP